MENENQGHYWLTQIQLANGREVYDLRQCVLLVRSLLWSKITDRETGVVCASVSCYRDAISRSTIVLVTWPAKSLRPTPVWQQRENAFSAPAGGRDSAARVAALNFNHARRRRPGYLGLHTALLRYALCCVWVSLSPVSWRRASWNLKLWKFT